MTLKFINWFISTGVGNESKNFWLTLNESVSTSFYKTTIQHFICILMFLLPVVPIDTSIMYEERGAFLEVDLTHKQASKPMNKKFRRIDTNQFEELRKGIDFHCMIVSSVISSECLLTQRCIGMGKVRKSHWFRQANSPIQFRFHYTCGPHA